MRYTKEQIQQMQDVYKPSGHRIPTAREILREQYGFCPSEPTMRKYWKPLGYKSFIPGGLHIGEHDRRYNHQNKEDPVVIARVASAYNAMKENWGILSKRQLARELGLPIAVVRRAIIKLKEQKLQKDATLEARIH